MIIGTRDIVGFQRLHHHRSGGTWGDSIASVLKASDMGGGTPDIPAIQSYLNGRRLPGRTILREVQAVLPGYELLRAPQGQGLLTRPRPAMPEPRHKLEDALRQALQDALDSGKRLALALSGGLDSALLLALLRDMGALPRVQIYVLATNLPGYCEREMALDMARQAGMNARIIQASEHDFVAALPDASRAIEEPMFNLHPVAKLVLARAMAADGIELAITGDGADQVMRRDQSADYLPLCNALFGSAGVALRPPFVDARVINCLTMMAPDPHKQCLRNLGAGLDLPDRLVSGPKQGRLAPTMELGPMLDLDRIHALAYRLGLPPPSLKDDAERVLWASLAFVLEALSPAS